MPGRLVSVFCSVDLLGFPPTSISKVYRKWSKQELKKEKGVALLTYSFALVSINVYGGAADKKRILHEVLVLYFCILLKFIMFKLVNWELIWFVYIFTNIIYCIIMHYFSFAIQSKVHTDSLRVQSDKIDEKGASDSDSHAPDKQKVKS